MLGISHVASFSSSAEQKLQTDKLCHKADSDSASGDDIDITFVLKIIYGCKSGFRQQYRFEPRIISVQI